MLKQRTLKTTIKTTGVGLHTGARVELVLRPAAPDTGIVFHRVDLERPVSMPADARNVGDTRLSSTLKRDGVVDLHGRAPDVGARGARHRQSPRRRRRSGNPDHGRQRRSVRVPAAVGGIVEQEPPKRYLRILLPVEVREGDKWARFDPYNGFKLDFTIDFPHPMFGSENRSVVIDFAEHSYVKEVARARTFGFMQEVEAMRAAGLGLGGSLQNAIVLDEYRVLNSEGLRYDNEFVKHKVLDAIGDLYLLGHPLIGQYTAFKSGHGLNNALARALQARTDAFELVTFVEPTDVPSAFQDWQLSSA